jgi:hypothetical protein
MKNVFFPNREVIAIQSMNMLLAVLVVILYVIDSSSGVRMAALVATVALAVTLIPARLMGLKWPAKFDADLLQVARNGKWLGIWTCIWFMLYTALALPAFYGPNFQPLQLVQRETFTLTLSLLIFVCLLALSNKWSYAHVRWWKQFNMLIWLTIPLLFAHLLLAGNVFNFVGAFGPSYVVFGLITLAGVSGIFRAKRDYFAFWRLWILLGGAIVTALAVWLYPVIL